MCVHTAWCKSLSLKLLPSLNIRLGIIPLIVLIAGMALSLGSCDRVQAQINQVDDMTRTPSPGTGHDYIHLLSETVDPSNGSVNMHISMPTPPGRGISLPFAVNYNSGSFNHLTPLPPQ